MSNEYDDRSLASSSSSTATEEELYSNGNYVSGGGATSATATVTIANAFASSLPKEFNINGTVSKSFSQNAESRQFNLKLIHLVHDRPELYDINCPANKSNMEREKGWKDVAQCLNQEVEFVKTRWKTMRDRFKKECRKFEQGQKITWTHFREMTFLQPFFRFKTNGYPRQKCETNENAHTSADSVESAQYLLDLISGQNELTQHQHESNALSHSPHLYHASGDEPDGAEEDNTDDSNHFENNGISTDCTIMKSEYNLEGEICERQAAVVSASIITPNSTLSCRSGERKRHAEQSCISSLRRSVKTADFSTTASAIGWRDENGADDEDVLFCRIMLNKLRKMDEQLKDTAKARVLDLLVQIQYGEGSAYRVL